MMYFGMILVLTLIILCIVTIYETVRLIHRSRNPKPNNIRPLPNQNKKLRSAASRKICGKDVVYIKYAPSDLDGSGYRGQ